jgi:predicted Zn-dependent peptidase
MHTRYHFPPAYEQQTLSNGLTVLWVPHHEHDGLLVGVQIPVGKFHDPAGREGTAQMCLSLLQKATQSLSPEQVNETVEQCGAHFFASVYNEYTTIGCRMLPAYADRMVPLFWEMLRAPSFEQREMEQLKKEVTTQLHSEVLDPSTVALRHLFTRLYDKDRCPAGRFHTLRSIKAISLADIRRFFETHIRPAHSHCVMIGNMDVDAMKTCALSHMEQWQHENTAAPARIDRADTHDDAARIYLVHKKAISQTSLAMGHPVPGERFEDRHALLLANYIFGGGNFSSRLLNAVRTAQGKTYSISSHLSLNTHVGTFVAQTTTQHGALSSVLSTFTQEYERLHTHGITTQELENAKKYVIGNMAFQLEGIDNLAEKLLWLRLHDLPDSYIAGYADRISALSREHINEVVRAHLTARPCTIAACGDKTHALAPLQALDSVAVTPLNASIA